MREGGAETDATLYAEGGEEGGDHEPVCLTAHLTGCMLIEAACTLQ